MRFIQPKCPKCGSHNIHMDAVAGWDPAMLDWTLLGVHDNATCGDCEYETDKVLPFEDVTDITARRQLVTEFLAHQLTNHTMLMYLALEDLLKGLTEAKAVSPRPSSGVDAMLERVQTVLQDIREKQLLALNPQETPADAD